MSHLLLTAAAALLATASAKQCTSTARSSSAGQWLLTFEDTFSGGSLNTSNWNVNDHNPTTSEYDGHDALFVKEAISVSDGALTITTALNQTTFEGIRYNMSSGWIDSQNKVWQDCTGGKACRFECNMKMPVAGAQGAWPACWLLPTNACWPVSGEVDIVEIWMGEGHYQHNKEGNPISMASTYHYGYSCSEDKSDYNIDSRWYPNMSDTSYPLIDFSADYHTFGVEINDTALRFYVDNATSFVRPLDTLCVTNSNFTWGHTAYMGFQPWYMIINTAVSQNSNTTWWESNNATTLVDWVRWYQWQPSEEAKGVEADGGSGGEGQACSEEDGHA